MKWNSGDILDGRYRIERKIGSGGMANVYRAVDLKSRRLVAIKALKEEFSQNGEFVRRFRSEAEAVLQLNHDNIVRSFDVAQEGETQYIVLEYIEGKTLKQLIRDEGPLTPARAIPIAMQICDALAHAHDRLLIHRDVKPQNIIITPKGRAKITDFGIARFADANTMTYAGANILGSVHYISPEQARGEVVNVTSDLYSVGIVLYEMLTAKLPFDSDNTVSVAIKHIQEAIIPPIEWQSGIGRALNDIVLKATRKDEALRYQSARELKRDLQRALREPDGDFVQKMGSELPSERLPRRLRYARTRWGKALNIAVGTVIVLGILISLGMIVRTVFLRGAAEKLLIPQLAGKTERQAFDRCDELGLRMVVEVTESNKEYPAGQVFRQSPSAGTPAKANDLITVGISAGPAEITAPALLDYQWSEARSILDDMKIPWEITFEPNELPDGTVFKQIPDPDTPLEPDDRMEIWVSGQPENMERVPSLTNVQLDEAVAQLKTSGFERVLVTYVQNAGGVGGTVTNQLPSGGDNIPGSEAVKLWVLKPEHSSFIAQDALNISVEVQDSKVMVTAKDDIVETILYEDTLPASKQHVIPVTVESDRPGTRKLIVYINGLKYREKEIQLETNKNTGQ